MKIRFEQVRFTRLSRFLLPALLVLGAPVILGRPAVLAQAAPGRPVADAARGQGLSGSCAGCHGAGRAPTLSGRSAAGIQAALLAFRAGTRPNGTMQRVAGALSDQDIADLAAFYGTPAAPPVTSAAGTTLTGETLYSAGDPARGVLACVVCHGETGEGAETLGIPALKGRSAPSVLTALRAYKAAPVTGIPYPDAMRIALGPMTDADLTAVAAYVATLK
ncbi:c-type cytochrome [Deinococcus depolymerans]|uniref:Cytochrome c4 n=1 Tax=Deinococcus depolymerans TaxID=392408 RepID=A0ABN1BJ52_9DEIO